MIISPEIHLQSESLFCILQLVGPKRIILCLVFFLSTFGVICGRFFFFQWIPFICWSNKRKEFIWSSLTNNPIEVDCIFLYYCTSNLKLPTYAKKFLRVNFEIQTTQTWKSGDSGLHALATLTCWEVNFYCTNAHGFVVALCDMFIYGVITL